MQNYKWIMHVVGDKNPVLGAMSNMSAHVLLKLSNELGKRNKMRGLPNILSLFRNDFNKFNNTRARMLDSLYHMSLKPQLHCHDSSPDSPRLIPI